MMGDIYAWLLVIKEILSCMMIVVLISQLSIWLHDSFKKRKTRHEQKLEYTELRGKISLMETRIRKIEKSLDRGDV